MKFLTIAVSAAVAIELAAAQTRTVTDSLVPTESARATISSFASESAVPTGQACAVVSSQLAAQSDDPPLIVAASLANECARSAPIVEQDALRLIDGIRAALEFQSNVGHLANPPAEYPLAGVDLFREIDDLRSQVSNGDFEGEIDFQRNFSAILGRAQDGHLNFAFDGLGVFVYQRLVGGLVSVSNDGTSTPDIYLCTEFFDFQNGNIEDISAVTQINGQDVVEFLASYGQNTSYGGFQDADALYNQMFYALNAGVGDTETTGQFAFDRAYPGDETTIQFANGSTYTEQNIAIFRGTDFTGLESGEDFYNLFCNATLKALAQGYDIDSDFSSGSKTIDKLQKHDMQLKKRELLKKRSEQKRQESQTVSIPTSTQGTVFQTATQLTGYPTPVALSDDLTLSGYFLEEDGFDDTAVLVLQAMSEADPLGFQAALYDFMDQCRSQNKRHLILDVQGNPGGTISLGYDVFKQLFPDIFPYGAGTLRAHEGLDTLGSFYTNFTSQLVQETPNDFMALLQANYYMQFSAEAWANSSGQLFESWEQLYGPVETDTDDFTNLIRWNINDTNFNLASGNIVISGFGNNTEVQPSPFASEDIILLTDGRCSSTCAILAHLLKYQGKVKQVTMGGRPQTGAMQAVGGVKGSQVYQYALLASDVWNAYQYSDFLGYTDYISAIEESSILNPIFNDSDYLIFRGASAGVGAESLSDFTMNFQNNIAEYDESYTPLQFVYEAADCRMWFQPSHINDIQNLWHSVASQAFGLNDTELFSLCVEGSTNSASSLSGNATLYNDGAPVNVTTFLPEQGEGSDSDSAAGRTAVSTAATIIALAAAIFAL